MDSLAGRFSFVVKNRQAIEIAIAQLQKRFGDLEKQAVEKAYLRELERVLESNPTVMAYVLVVTLKPAVDELMGLAKQQAPKMHAQGQANLAGANLPEGKKQPGALRKFFRWLLPSGRAESEPAAG